MTETPLKLRAEDAEDVEVISAVLQDAIAPLCDMVFLPDEKRFIMVVHRFRWCDGYAESHESPCFERICCAVTVHDALAVQVQDIDQTHLDQMLELLTVILNDNELHFVFAGTARVKVKLGSWSLKIEDFGEAWPTTHQPEHG